MTQHQVRADDGRVARRLENRVRILDALVVLIRSGQSHPTLKEIAARAGVTSRTLLNHFPDVGSLLMAAGLHGLKLSDSKLPGVDHELAPEARVRAFFRAAVNFYEAYSAIRWATLTSPAEVPGFDPRQRKGRVLAMIDGKLDELFAGFGVELAKDRELRQAVWVMVDPLAWRLLRVQQGLSRPEAASTMARGVIALAHAASASSAPRVQLASKPNGSGKSARNGKTARS
jgi:AcrR family transcriptional regulator